MRGFKKKIRQPGDRKAVMRSAPWPRPFGGHLKGITVMAQISTFVTNLQRTLADMPSSSVRLKVGEIDRSCSSKGRKLIRLGLPGS